MIQIILCIIGGLIVPPEKAVNHGIASTTTYPRRRGSHARLYRRLTHQDGQQVTPQEVIKPYYGTRWNEAVQKAQAYQKSQRPRQPGEPYRYDLSSRKLNQSIPVRWQNTGSAYADYGGGGLFGRSEIRIDPNKARLGAVNTAAARGLSPHAMQLLGHETRHSLAPYPSRLMQMLGRDGNDHNLKGVLSDIGISGNVTHPAELAVRLGQAKARYFDDTGILVDTPEKAKKALQWLVQKNRQTQKTSPNAVAPELSSLIKGLQDLRRMNSENSPMLKGRPHLSVPIKDIDDALQRLYRAMPGYVRGHRGRARRYYG